MVDTIDAYIDDEDDEEEVTALSVITPDPVDSDKLSDDLWAEMVKLKNPYLENTTFKPIKKEDPKHKDAFLFWSSISDNFRTDKAVAEKFEVSAAVVGRWRKSFNWAVRREHMQQDNLERVQDAASRGLGNQVLKMVSTVDLVCDSFHNQVAMNRVDISVQDFIKLCELGIRLRKELGEDLGNREGSDVVQRIENVLSGAGGDVKQLLVGSLNMFVSGSAKLPHDEILEAAAARETQEIIEINEIGEEYEEDDDDDSEYANTA